MIDPFWFTVTVLLSVASSCCGTFLVVERLIRRVKR